MLRPESFDDQFFDALQRGSAEKAAATAHRMARYGFSLSRSAIEAFGGVIDPDSGVSRIFPYKLIAGRPGRRGRPPKLPPDYCSPLVADLQGVSRTEVELLNAILRGDLASAAVRAELLASHEAGLAPAAMGILALAFDPAPAPSSSIPYKLIFSRRPFRGAPPHLLTKYHSVRRADLLETRAAEVGKLEAAVEDIKSSTKKSRKTLFTDRKKARVRKMPNQGDSTLDCHRIRSASIVLHIDRAITRCNLPKNLPSYQCKAPPHILV